VKHIDFSSSMSRTKLSGRSGAAMATPQAIALFNALKNIRAINSKLAATDGALTSTVCLAYDEPVLISVSLSIGDY
jgi:hypothetical protein